MIVETKPRGQRHRRKWREIVLAPGDAGCRGIAIGITNPVRASIAIAHPLEARSHLLVLAGTSVQRRVELLEILVEVRGIHRRASGIEERAGRRLDVATPVRAELRGCLRVRTPLGTQPEGLRVARCAIVLGTELADRPTGEGVPVTRHRPGHQPPCRRRDGDATAHVVALKRGPGGVKCRWRQVECIPLMASRAEKERSPACHSADVPRGVERPIIAGTDLPRRLNGSTRITWNQIDDAADRIGPVERRGRAFDDLDPIEALYRLAVEIDRAALDAARGHDRLTVQQDEHLARIDPLELLAANIGALRSPTRDGAGHFVQCIRDGRIPGIAHRLAGQRRDWERLRLAQALSSYVRHDSHGLLIRCRRQDQRDDVLVWMLNGANSRRKSRQGPNEVVRRKGTCRRT